MLKLIQSIFLIWVLTISIVGQESKIENLNCNFHIKNLLLTNDGAEWVGLFIKGSQKEVRQFCEQHNALYRVGNLITHGFKSSFGSFNISPQKTNLTFNF